MEITIDDMLTKDTSICYSRKQVAKLWGDSEYLSLMDITHLDIPTADRIWAVSRFLDDTSNHHFAVDCAQRAVDNMSDQELKKQSTELLQHVTEFIDGKISINELAAYRAAGWAADFAAVSATDWAAYNAADFAAYRAVNFAAYNAAYKAAYNAAFKATDRSEEKKWQLRRLREYVTKFED